MRRISIPIYFKSPQWFLSGYGEEPENALAYYEAMGISVIEKKDDIFFIAELPDQWSFNHKGYWITVRDEKKRERFSFFYKTCPWDTDGFTRPTTRFTIHRVLDEPYDPEKDQKVQLQIMDAGKEIFSCDPKVIKNHSGKYPYESEEARLARIACFDKVEIVENKQRAICQQWLQEHYPEWTDILAYW